MKNLSAFANEYRKQLKDAIAKYPDKYCYGLESADSVADKMTTAFEHGTYNKDGLAIKWTCNALGVKYTYAGINSFLNGI